MHDGAVDSTLPEEDDPIVFARRRGDRSNSANGTTEVTMTPPGQFRRETSPLTFGRGRCGNPTNVASGAA
jgi:hypothetical protein